MYDVEMGFPGSIIDGTACAGGGGEPPSLSELYEDMVAGVEGDRHQLDRLDVDINAYGNPSIHSCLSATGPIRLVFPRWKRALTRSRLTIVGTSGLTRWKR